MRTFITIGITILVFVSMYIIERLLDGNQGMITIHLLSSRTYEISIAAFSLISMATGAGFILLLYIIRDVRRFLRGLRGQREQKKRLKIQEHYSKGLNALLAKRNNEAIRYFQKVLVIDPNHVETLLRLGISHLRAKNVPEAVLLYQKALSLSPDNLEVMFALAAGFEEAKRYEDALTMYKRIISKDSTNLTAVIRMRDLYQRQSQWEQLYEAQSNLLSYPLSPPEQEVEHRKLVGYKYEFGRSLLEAGLFDRARKVFRGVIKLDKNFIPAYLGLGEVYLEENKTKEAAALWEKAYKMTSSNVLLHRLEDFYLKQGEPSKAIEIYKQAVSWKPQDISLKFFLGKLYYRLEMIDEAFDVLSAVDFGERDYLDAHKLLGNIYLRRGSLGLAAAEFKKALGFKKAIIIPYVCSNCKQESTPWSGQCPNCGRWNTFGIKL